MLEDFNLRPGESFGLSDPAIVNKYWNRPVEVDHTVDDGDVLDVGGLKLEVVHLPGHCPGSYRDLESEHEDPLSRRCYALPDATRTVSDWRC